MGCFQSVESACVEAPNPHEIDLSHYKIIRIIGKGGFGKVHLVENRIERAEFALKRIQKSLIANEEELIKGAFVELNVLKAIQSPFVVPFHCSFQNQMELFLVLEYLKGGDIRYHLNSIQRFHEDQVIFYARQLVCALEDIHDKKILYRDMKPENLLLDERGNLRLIDFGLSILLSSPAQLVHGSRLGTIPYMSPEMFFGRGYNIDCDYWSLLVVLHEMLTGFRPFPDLENDPKSVKIDSFKFSTRILTTMQLSYLDHWCDLFQRGFDLNIQCRLSNSNAFKQHSLFATDWHSVRDLKVAPFVPDSSVLCNSNEARLLELLVENPGRPVCSAADAKFSHWNYNNQTKEVEASTVVKST
jgi:protein-serine/threonine kinase